MLLIGVPQCPPVCRRLEVHRRRVVCSRRGWRIPLGGVVATTLAAVCCCVVANSRIGAAPAACAN